MKLWALKHIRCLNCKEELKLEIDRKESYEIIEGSLKCSCGKIYHINKGIPRMLSDEFLEKSGIEETKSKVASKFAYEWKKFPKLYDEYENQFLDWIYPVKKEFFKNKLVLDAGCGTGRHVFNAAKFGATVIGIDLGDSVEVAFENTKHLENTCIIQADIYNLPFEKEEFDYIYSIGVIHHLPFPQQGFNSLLNHLKNKGVISIWVYGREGNGLLKITEPLRKYFFSKIPISFANFLAYLFAMAVFPLSKLCSKIKIGKRIFPQFEFLEYLGKMNFRIVHSIIFDQMLAPIANYYTKEEFEKWFREANLKRIIITHRNNNSWRGFGTK